MPYHTIDPIILETLHLNEERIQRILDILHGKQKEPQKSYRLPKIREPSSLSTHKDANSLPNILQTHRIREQKKRKQGITIDVATLEQQQSFDKKNKRTKNKQQKINQEEEKQSFQTKIHKKREMEKAYMQMQLDKSRAVDRKFKDMYRTDVQRFIREEVEIDKLPQAEKKIERLKKRHQYLKTFDLKYFLKLNQPDLNSI